METVIITRHKALVDYLIEKNIISKKTKTIEHATIEDIKDKHVIGILPLNLACYTSKITIIPLTIPFELRGKELTLNDIKKYAGKIETYNVTKIED